MAWWKRNLKEKTTKTLRKQLADPGIILEGSAYNPLTAVLVESLGYKQIWVAGWGTGAQYTYTEPQTTMMEFEQYYRNITDVVSIPVVVDGCTGFGNPIDVMRTVRQFERAGIAGMTLEDQIYPKRMQYHQSPQVKYVIPADEMVLKIKAAKKAQEDPDFVIVARTDGYKCVGGSMEEAIRRLKLYEEAGADALRAAFLMDDLEVLKEFREWSQLPWEAGLSKDEAPGVAGKITLKVLEDLGYKIARTSVASIAVQWRANKDMFENIINGRPWGLTQKEFRELRQDILETYGVNALIEEEIKTTKPPYTGKVPY